MAHYVVTATPRWATFAELRRALDEDEVRSLRPFGRELHRCLQDARWDAEAKVAVWEEEDHCTPPLAMEREAVLDDHFTGIQVEAVDRGDGWARLEDLPSLWTHPRAP